MTRVLSGIQPSGDLHLGNYVGAIRNWARIQHTADAFHPVVDLHAVTVPQEPGELGRATLRMSQMLMAAGLNPEVCTIFVQSHVREHTECAWLLECTVSFGELSRMTQFKDKSGQQEFISAGLFTYPALQAADILLYDADEVPVGADQRQHIELTRDIAERFNSRYGPTFKPPKAVVPAAGARVMDLQNPTNKMSKSLDSPRGTVDLLDDPSAVARKIKSAVTDSDAEVRATTSGPSPGCRTCCPSWEPPPTGRPRRSRRTIRCTGRSKRTQPTRSSNCCAPSRPASPSSRPTPRRRPGC